MKPGHLSNRRWKLLVLIIIVGFVVAIGAALRHQHRLAMLDRLDSSDPAERMEAIGYWFNGDMNDAGRLSGDGAMLKRLDERSGGFSPAALSRIFEEVVRPRHGEWFTLGYKAPRTLHRSIVAAVEQSPRDAELRHRALTVLDLSLQLGGRDGRAGLVWNIADQEERELIFATLVAINKAAAADPEAGPGDVGTLAAISLIGEDAQAVLEPMLDARSITERRRAWLHLGALRPQSGYSARWQDAPPPVAEAMIAASVVLADDAGRAIEGFRASERAAGEFGDVLDALAGLPRDTSGRIDLDADWPERSGEADLLADLKIARSEVAFAVYRFGALRDRDAKYYSP